MRGWFGLIVIGALALAAPAGAAGPVEGVWFTKGNQAKVRIAPCGASVCGAIVWLADEAPGATLLDVRNTDAAKRTRPIRGAPMLFDFKPGPKGWVQGRIYNAEDGRTYRAELLPQANGTLHVKGCMGPVCQTQTWTPAPAP